VADQWREILPLIAADRRVMALDSRGSGASDAAANGNTPMKAAPRISPPWRMHETSPVSPSSPTGSGGAALLYAAGSGARGRLFLLDLATDPRAIPKGVRDDIVTGLAGPRSLEFQKQFYATIAGHNGRVAARVIADCEKVVAPARLAFGKAFADWDPEAALDAWKGPFFILAGKASDNGSALYHLCPHIPQRSSRARATGFSSMCQISWRKPFAASSPG